MYYTKLLTLLCSAAFLVACGGGGGTSEDSAAPIEPTPTAATNYSGTWSGTYNGSVFYYDVVQTGNIVALTNITPGLPAGQKSTGTIIGNSALVSQNDFAVNATATLNLINASTIIATQNSCIANPGYVCLVQNNIPITYRLGATVPSIPVDPGTGSISYAGNYGCSFNGTDVGNFSFVLTTTYGSISNCKGSSTMTGQQFLCTGQITNSGYVTTAFASTGAVAVGQSTATGLTGTWTNSGGAGGNISCTKS